MLITSSSEQRYGGEAWVLWAKTFHSSVSYVGALADSAKGEDPPNVLLGQNASLRSFGYKRMKDRCNIKDRQRELAEK